MWSVGSEGRLYVSTDMALFEGASSEAAFRVDADGWRNVVEAVRAQFKLRTSRPRRLRVWVSGGLARPFLLDDIAGLRDRDEALRTAQAMAPDATGLPQPCTAWLDAWRPGQACFVAATEQALLAVLQALAVDLRIRLGRIEPWWNVVLSERLLREGPPDLLAVEEPDGLTLLGVTQGRVSLAQSHCPLPSEDRILSQLRRVATSRGISNEQLVRAAFGQTVGQPDGATVRWLSATP